MRAYRFLLPIFLIAGASQAYARATDFSPVKNAFPETVLPGEDVISEDKPVSLTADKIDYLQQQDTVVASGHVEVVQGDTLVLADQMVYDRRNEIVTARGNISVMDSTGTVMFAEEIVLRDEMLAGVIEQFKLRFSDDSLFAAAHAERINEDVMELDRALYSPCKVKCADELEPGDEPKAPLWQLRADHVTIDQKKESIVYDNAWMELYGLPVFYTPYLSHATPNAGAKSGIVIPEYERNEILGNVFRLPVYYAIAPDRDATITPISTSKEGLLLRVDYRQKFDSGMWVTESSITNPRERDIFGNLNEGHDIRGHFYTKGNFDVDEDTRWGFDIKRTTDDTYMRKYGIDESVLLQSKIYSESSNFIDSSDRNFFGAEALAFQGLAATDDTARIPKVLPMLNFNYESDPGSYGSRYYLESNALVLMRETGTKSRRLSNTLGWRLPYISDGGQVIEFNSHIRGDLYEVSDVMLSNGREFDGLTGRFVPEASVLWRYPFINQLSKTRLMIEPVINATVSPNGGNQEEIPNEDSLVPEFTDSNLFSSNRFAGYDRIEHGPRVSYGLRGLVNYRKAYVDWLLGQHFRVEDDRNFPFSNDVADNLSDYVGKFGVQLSPLYIAYRFRLDKQSFDAKRKEVDISYSAQRMNFNLAYLSLQNDPIFASREEVVAAGTVELTQNWSIGGGVRRDLMIDQLTSAGAELIFKNECVNISGVVNREYTRDREVKPRTRYLVRLTLKNLN